MKQNDIVSLITIHPAGTTLAHNFPDEASVVNFMVHEFKCVEKGVKYQVSPDTLNPGAYSPVLTEAWEEVIKGKVNWVVDKVVSITTEGRTFTTENAEGEGWGVIEEAPLTSPNEALKQSASEMSIEELRANIEKLRGMRKVPERKSSSAGGRGLISPSDPLAGALAKLSPEKLKLIKEKLGLS